MLVVGYISDITQAAVLNSLICNYLQWDDEVNL